MNRIIYNNSIYWIKLSEIIRYIVNTLKNSKNKFLKTKSKFPKQIQKLHKNVN